MNKYLSSIILLLCGSSFSGCSYIYSLFHSKESSKAESNQNEGYRKFLKEQMKKDLKPFQKYYEQGETVNNSNYRIVIPESFYAIDDEETNVLIAQTFDGSKSVTVQVYNAEREGEIGCDSLVDFYKKEPTVGFIKIPYFVKTNMDSGCELFVQHIKNDNVKYNSFSFTDRLDSNRRIYELSASINQSVISEDYINLIKDFFKTANSSEIKIVLNHMEKKYKGDEKILKEKHYDVSVIKLEKE